MKEKDQAQKIISDFRTLTATAHALDCAADGATNLELQEEPANGPGLIKTHWKLLNNLCVSMFRLHWIDRPTTFAMSVELLLVQQLFHQMGPDPVPNPHRGVGLIARSDAPTIVSLDGS